jgi:hypothetical protein
MPRGEWGPAHFQEQPPPTEVTLSDGYRVMFNALGSYSINVTDLPRPLPTDADGAEDRLLTDEELAYMETCDQARGAVWHEAETFIATVASDQHLVLRGDTFFDSHLVLTELIQNAFRHGRRPQNVWVSVGLAQESLADEQRPFRLRNSQLKVVPLIPSQTGFRVLIGVQDQNFRWVQPRPEEDELPDHLRGLDIVRGVSQAVWHQSDGESSKWVWAIV